MHDLLSPGARRLLSLLSPEPIRLSVDQLSKPQIEELQRFGLIVAEYGQGGFLSIRLTRNGRQQVPSVNH